MVGANSEDIVYYADMLRFMWFDINSAIAAFIFRGCTNTIF